jgi:hypothetical protein
MSGTVVKISVVDVPETVCGAFMAGKLCDDRIRCCYQYPKEDEKAMWPFVVCRRDDDGKVHYRGQCPTKEKAVEVIKVLDEIETLEWMQAKVARKLGELKASVKDFVQEV